jgi:hypothetical protein
MMLVSIIDPPSRTALSFYIKLSPSPPLLLALEQEGDAE